MNKYNIYIQDKLYKTVEANNTGDALAHAAKDIQDNKVSFLDKTKDSKVRIENVN